MVKLIRAIPVLKTCNMIESESFYFEKLGFDCQTLDDGSLRAMRGGIEIRLRLAPVWESPAACRIEVGGIETLFEEYSRLRIVESSNLSGTSGARRFSVADPSGNIIEFFEDTGTVAVRRELVKEQNVRLPVYC